MEDNKNTTDDLNWDEDIDLDLSDEPDYGSLYNDEPVRRNRKASRKKIIIIAGAVTAAVVCLIVAAVLIERFVPNKEWLNLNNYYAVTGDEVCLVYNYEITDASVFIRDGHYYVDNGFISDNITDKFYLDEKNMEVLYTTADAIWTIPVGSSMYTEGTDRMETEYVISYYENDTLYIAIDFIYGKADFVYEELNAPYRLVIRNGQRDENVVEFEEKAVVRESASVKGKIVADEDDKAQWILIGKQKSWYNVITADGRKGYVKSSRVNVTETREDYDTPYIYTPYPSMQKDYDICLVWDAIYTEGDNNGIADRLKDTKCVTTVSPTWYQVVDEEGNISSFADWEYIRYIHDSGMEIWPLISDFTSVDGENGWDEYEMFSDTDSRRNLIENIMNEITTYGYDGINIDFEKVPKEAGAAYTQFIRELSIRCREEKVVLSVDNYVPMSHTEHYNRKAQGECVDYVIVMGYDEHYSGGSEAGSVASIEFVENGMDRTLESVPADKVINGVPFYTRLWIDGTDENGERAFTSSSCSMQEGLDYAEELGLTSNWDDTVKQYVAKGYSGTLFYSIWLEEEEPMSARVEAIKERNIAGIAAWRLGMELDSIWDIFSEKYYN